jgi:hypothetical protein
VIVAFYRIFSARDSLPTESRADLRLRGDVEHKPHRSQ